MITLRPAAERGHFDHGWLDTSHSFSFAAYHDPRHMGFRSLRVINEDRVQPGTEFGTHGHRDMEILSWVLEGQLAHKDDMGNGSIIKPGEAQRMSAGTGVMHSERNPSAAEPAHFLQIWLLPERRGLAPGYEQKNFADARGLRLLASRDGRDGSVTVHQDADVWLARLAAGESAELQLRAGRGAWVQMARGGAELRAGGKSVKLAQGDGASVEDVAEMTVVADGECEALLFDLV
jgi:redox-sensitive bicupin YhaK (pirin superfamily)